MAGLNGPPFTAQLLPLFGLLIREAEGDVDGLFARFGVPPEAASVPEWELPLHTFTELGEAAAEAAGQPFLGLRCANLLPRGTYGLMEFVARSAPDVGAGLEAAARYSRLLNRIMELRVDAAAGDGEATLRVQVPGEPLGVGRHANEFTLALFTQLIRELSGRAFAPRRVWFAHPAPALLEPRPLEDHFGGAPLEFGRGESGMAFDAEVLRWPLVSADPVLHAALDARVRADAAQVPAAAPDFPAQVREAISRALEAGDSEQERVAGRLQVSERTLQRRLGEAGTTFKELLDEVREQAARAYLADPTLGVTEVAFRLAYSDVRAFARAFRRWTGRSPGEFREALAGE